MRYVGDDMVKDARLTRDEKGRITKVDGKFILEGYDEWIKKDREKYPKRYW